ncbi:general odorant-binding protein 71 [Anthonomus grandis grandis]|uniref:general odorant-binding protein 71 n=1 Tax=Anthonomus grandis grandis TaxID=2921223 RepID=UPI0021652F67|nr:general odorant-binding protein 71 [Anthonomus grandis grandis]
MKSVVLIVLFCFVANCKGLDCGISKLGGDKFKKVLTECVKDNKTLETIWDITSSMSIEDDEESSISSDEVPITRGLANNLRKSEDSNTNFVTRKSFRRSKRSRYSKGLNSESGMNNMQRKYGTKTSTTTEEATTVGNDPENKNSIESNDTCVLQCVFEKLELTDSNGVPDHKKFVDALLQTVNTREVRDFIQETTDECFQNIEEDNIEDSCEYSKKLLNCMAEKGRSNCDDWPTGTNL